MQDYASSFTAGGGGGGVGSAGSPTSPSPSYHHHSPSSAATALPPSSLAAAAGHLPADPSALFSPSMYGPHHPSRSVLSYMGAAAGAHMPGGPLFTPQSPSPPAAGAAAASMWQAAEGGGAAVAGGQDPASAYSRLQSPNNTAGNYFSR